MIEETEDQANIGIRGGPRLANAARLNSCELIRIGNFGRMLGPTYRAEQVLLPHHWARMNFHRAAWLARGNTDDTNRNYSP